MHYRDAAGRYLGAWDGATPPEGAIAVTTPPPHRDAVWTGNAWAYDATPAPLPHGDFCRMCAWTGVTSHAEAVAFGRDRTLPAFFAAVFATLPTEAQPAAELEAVTAGTFRFDHPLVVAAGGAKGWTEATRRAVWKASHEAAAVGWTKPAIAAVQAAAAVR